MIFRSFGYTLTVRREEMIAERARRWFGVAGPRLYDLKMAEVRRIETAIYLRDRQSTLGRLFPPPPEPVLASPADWCGE